MIIVKVNLAVGNLTVRSFDKSEIVNLCINAKRRNQTDIRAFRGLDRTQTAIMGIVHVTNLETCTLTRQTAGAQSRQTALMGDFSQRVRLVHELRQRISAEERVDNRRNRLGIDKVNRSEHLIVTHVHALADSARHTCQTHTELVVELLPDCAHTAVAQVVDIVDISLRVDKFDKILDNLDDILLRQNLNIHRSGQTQFLVDAVAAHLTKVITLL